MAERRYRGARAYRDGELICGELEQLVPRRGAGAARIGDRIQSIELVIDDPQRDSQRLVGRLEPPQWRRWELSENEFVIREHL
jgi:hypothetical protein